MTIKNLKDMPNKKWAGGKTIELFRDQADFNIRISCAYIDIGESVFSDFSGYQRILHILEGKTTLNIDKSEVQLTENQTIYFDGNQDVTSKNDIDVLDFNIIYKKDVIEASFSKKIKETLNKKTDNIFIFSREDGTKLYFKDRILTLNENDFVLLDEKIKEYRIEGSFLAVTF